MKLLALLEHADKHFLLKLQQLLIDSDDIGDFQVTELYEPMVKRTAFKLRHDGARYTVTMWEQSDSGNRWYRVRVEGITLGNPSGRPSIMMSDDRSAPSVAAVISRMLRQS